MWILFWDHRKIGLYLGVIFMHYRVFLYVKVQNEGYLGGGVLIFQLFFWGGGVGCLKFLIVFWVMGRCWARA